MFAHILIEWVNMAISVNAGFFWLIKPFPSRGQARELAKKWLASNLWAVLPVPA